MIMFIIAIDRVILYILCFQFSYAVQYLFSVIILFPPYLHSYIVIFNIIPVKGCSSAVTVVVDLLPMSPVVLNTLIIDNYSK